MTNEAEPMPRISHDEAKEIAQRLINSVFGNVPRAHIEIPANPSRDDDIRIMDYIEQQSHAASGPVWKPIATAPGDGSSVIVGRALQGSDPAVSGEAYFDLEIESWWWANTGGPGDYWAEAIIPEPTHWAELPAPPVAMTERQER